MRRRRARRRRAHARVRAEAQVIVRTKQFEFTAFDDIGQRPARVGRRLRYERGVKGTCWCCRVPVRRAPEIVRSRLPRPHRGLGHPHLRGRGAVGDSGRRPPGVDRSQRPEHVALGKRLDAVSRPAIPNADDAVAVDAATHGRSRSTPGPRPARR